MKIILNADDFGIDIDRDRGIAEAVRRGYISSVSVIVTNHLNREQISLIKEMKKKVSVGLHINLTDNPLIKYQTEDFCNRSYSFNRSKYNFWANAICDTINIRYIEEEVIAQFKKFNEMFSFLPNHMDGHNHCNIFNRRVNDIFEKCAFKHQIHLRIPFEKLDFFERKRMAKRNNFKDYRRDSINFDVIKNNFNYYFKYDMLLYNFLCINNCHSDKIAYMGTMYGYFRTSKVFIEQIKNLRKESVIQVMTHPGFYDKKQCHNSLFSNKDRVKELKSLKKVKKYCKKNKIDYITYNDIL
ncbi:MAG: ChbG/HpnK family deacetylase [Anaeroplasmataceae bacterium]|nr:ChbG/HpnK family deacetylase [Anaeroplasmataceae bacterium]